MTDTLPGVRGAVMVLLNKGHCRSALGGAAMVRIAGKVQKLMSVNEIDEAVARATGEDVRTIAWLGFVLLDPTPTGVDEDGTKANGSQADANSPVDEIDWDGVDLERYLAMCG